MCSFHRLIDSFPLKRYRSGVTEYICTKKGSAPRDYNQSADLYSLFFTLASTVPTRGHPLKLFKPQILRDVRAHAFSQRVINDWNRLEANIVTAPSLSNQLYDKQYDAGL